VVVHRGRLRDNSHKRVVPTGAGRRNKKMFLHEGNEASEPRQTVEGLSSETLEPWTTWSEFNANSAWSWTSD